MSIITRAFALSLVATTFSCVSADQAPKSFSENKPAVAAAQAKATADVKIDNFNFLPHELKIDVGTKVTWVNADDVPHTATSKDEPQTFDSGAIDTDDKYSFTFTKPGKYTYYCKVHPHMVGVVIVK